jgi:hypothetical protein
MNERICKIESQAWEQVTRTNGLVRTEDFNQKFAELIVKECLQQCEQVRNDAITQKSSDFLTESGKLLYEGVFGGATNCGFAIQQHFGVEL